ncbi:MAG: ATP synthase F0 subunit B [Desulfobulbaceae bacterium]|nr:ATP synthase F0 subunit B [Desulfobulbaceae bacterium]
MIEIDLTMPFQIAFILIMIVIMNIVLYKPIRAILSEREKRIGGLEKDVDEFHKNAKLRLEEFDEKLNGARSRAKAELDRVRAETQAIGNEKVAELRKEVEAHKAENQSLIQVEFAKANRELQAQVDGFAREIAGKIIGRTV